jgi:hypothetical protein
MLVVFVHQLCFFCFSLAESDVKMRALVEDHKEKVEHMSAAIAEASKKAKDRAAFNDTSVFTMEIMELR